MNEARPGQRLLMALTSADDAEDSLETLSLSTLLAAVGGVLCLMIVVLMCTCKDGGSKKKPEDIELQNGPKKGGKRSSAEAAEEGPDPKPKAQTETVAVNGGPPVTVTTLPGHSRQASSGSAHMRPTSLRELPEPPVSTHARNTSLGGLELLSASGKGSGAGNGGGGGDSDPNYTYPQHPGNNSNKKSAIPASNGVKEKVKSHSDGYDHLGPKPSVKPTDYDSLADPESEDTETPLSETGAGVDSHYSQLRERTYAVVKDVKAKAKDLYDPYSTVKDKDDAGSDYYSQLKDEDPYNHIGDSDGVVSSSFRRRVRQSGDMDDPYATVQEGSDGDLKTILEERGAVGGVPHQPAPARFIPGSSARDSYNDGADEYAVVRKSRGVIEVLTKKERNSDRDGGAGDDGDDDGSEISPYNVGPPEPPRLYNDYIEEDKTFVVAASSKPKREHKYSKVTARESLASMSARNALNPYEVVPDLPENTYATVEGGSGDGVVMRGGATGGNEENRLSQSSDTYAEIGISGGGLSSSLISSNSSVGGNNNSSSSGAPVPPSLDSLHLMTKSQTSSEGDRLSDRHLASPEDSGLGLHQWAERGEDDSGESTEDGYSTLKKSEFSPREAALPQIPGVSRVTDEESGEVTLVPNYQTVKDCISDSEVMEEAENDPNYESVDETRAKVAALKARGGSGTYPPASSESENRNHVTVVKVIRINKSGEGSSAGTPGSQEESSVSLSASSMGQRRRRLDHDYEEVDLSPPSSPMTPTSSAHHTTMSSSYHSSSHTTSTTTTTVSSQHHNETGRSLMEERERVIQSHMYEELTEVRAKKSEMGKGKKSNSQDKPSLEDSKKKSGTNDKKKAEEKRKSGSEEKHKSGTEEKRKSGGEDKKKNAVEEKRKSGSGDKRKSGSAFSNGTRL